MPHTVQVCSNIKCDRRCPFKHVCCTRHFFQTMAMLIDEAIAEFGSNDWNYNESTVAVSCTRDPADTSVPLGIDDFIRGVLRPFEDSQKTRVMVDISRNDCEVGGITRMGPLINEKK